MIWQWAATIAVISFTIAFLIRNSTNADWRHSPWHIPCGAMALVFIVSTVVAMVAFIWGV